MDRYDTAIEYLTENPDEITIAWSHPGEHPGGALFQYASRDPEGRAPQSGMVLIGCLTQIRAAHRGERGPCYQAETDALTDAIAGDERLPHDADMITVADLPHFAEWQRRIDVELGRVCPSDD